MFPNDQQDWRPPEATPPPPAAPAPQIRRARRRSTAAVLVGVALFSALIGFAVDRYVTTSFSATPAPVAAAPTTIPSVPRIGAVAAQNGGSPTATATPAAA